MENCVIVSTIINSYFIGTNLKNIYCDEFIERASYKISAVSIAFSPDGKYLASGNWDSSVKMWSVESQKVVATLQGHGGYVESIAFSPDGKYLASGGKDMTIKLWNI
jgi:WD40 repeat protein